MASNQGKHRRNRLFEQLMQTAYEDGRSLEVMVATNAPEVFVLSYECQDADITLSVGRRAADHEWNEHALASLSPEEARVIAGMLLSAADAIDPDGDCDPAKVEDPWWTLEDWPFAWKPEIGHRVFKDRADNRGTVVAVTASDSCLVTIAWDSGEVRDHHIDEVDQIVQARLVPVSEDEG